MDDAIADIVPFTSSLFAEIVRLGRQDAEVRLELLISWAANQSPPGEPQAALADLDDAGRTQAWERDDGIVVMLTPLSADRLNLKLLPDSSRWVDRATKFQASKRLAGTRTIVETDLDDETETPLDQMVDPNAIEAIYLDLIYEQITSATQARVCKQRRNEMTVEMPPKYVLMGVHSYPFPGQDRGPWAPMAVPTEWEMEHGRVVLERYDGPTPGLCAACKASVLMGGSICEPCSRMANEDRLFPSGILEAAKEENREEWERWWKREKEKAREANGMANGINGHPKGIK